jgi:hypothetical protein
MRAVDRHAEMRRGEQWDNAETARRFIALTKGVAVETIVVWGSPWEIGWQLFPVTVVWYGPLDAATLRRVEEVRRIDAIFGVTGPDFWSLADAAEQGRLRGRFKLVTRRRNAPTQLLLRADLLPARP